MSECRYTQNRICSAFGEYLCADCRIKHYSSGQFFMQDQWNRGMALLVDGLIVTGWADESRWSQMVVSGMASTEDVIGISGLTEEVASRMTEKRMVFMLDSTVALFSEKAIKPLLENNVDFIKELSSNCLRHCGAETAEFACQVGGKDAYAAVSYVARYCKEHNVGPLTHEQIAFICNRRRPTVTNTIHEIIKREPELFSGC